MKITPLPLVVGLLLGARLLAATPENPVVQRPFAWVDAADPSITEVRRLGEQFIQRVGSNLVGEVQRVLAAKDALAAVDELHLKNLTLPGGAAGKPRVTALRLTSLRLRDPANQPDNADLAALISIQNDLTDGNTPPRLLVQRLEPAANGPAEWRIYRPIGVSPQCLACHGGPETVTPEVAAKLAKLYPEDKATGYSASAWRGVIRVSIVDDGAPPPAAAKKP